MDIKTLGELAQDGRYDEVVADLEKVGLAGLDRARIGIYFTCLRKAGDKRALASFLRKVRRLPGREWLDDSCADAAYLSTFDFLFLEETMRQVVELNDRQVSDQGFGALEERLKADKARLHSYVDENLAGYVRRTEAEYRYIRNLPLEMFPYKYLSDYRRTAPDRRQEPKSVSFIYCIKNRSARTSISVESLVRAYEKYLGDTDQPIGVEIILVEDIGQDMVKPFPASGAHRFIHHHVVDTHVTWTRSGLLNYGIKRSSSDLVAFCDVDFLFPGTFFHDLERQQRRLDFKKRILVVNCIETEAHQKDGRKYSKWSPYGYMWMVDRELAVGVGGFSEAYKGHGFEDRDFEHRLKSAYGLEIVASCGLDDRFVLLHLSHDTRTGDESRDDNRARYLASLKDRPAASDAWGEQDHVRSTDYEGLVADEMSAPGHGSHFDLLVMPHNRYHAWTISLIKEDLLRAGIKFMVLSPLPHYRDEGVEEFCMSSGLPFLRIADLCAKRITFGAFAVFNDWDGVVARPLLEVFKGRGIPTIGIIEGINDYLDVDTGRSRRAYRTVDRVLVPGEFDRRHYFADMGDLARVVGIPRLREIMKSGGAGLPAAGSQHVLVNCNFTYGVLEEKRNAWVREVVSACKSAGFSYEITRHPADKGDLSEYVVAEDGFYAALRRSTIVVSRFSSCILEALAVGVRAIYYNPGIEKVVKFQQSLGAYQTPQSEAELQSALEQVASGLEEDSLPFLEEHCSISAPAGPRIASSIRRAINESSPKGPDVRGLHDEIMKRFT